MRSLALGTLLLSSASIAITASSSNCSPTSADNKVLQYCSTIQAFSDRFYKANPVNQTNWSSAPNSDTTNYESELQGIGNENHIGALLIKGIASNLSDSKQPQCNNKIPTPENATDYLITAYLLEAEASGAFTGLASFTQAPEVSLLLNWLAVQHGTHATYIATTILKTVFELNGTSILPVYSPKVMLSNDTEGPYLGGLLDGCLEAPEAPCTVDETTTSSNSSDSSDSSDNSSDSMTYATASDDSEWGVPPVMPDASGISDLTARAMWKEQPTTTKYQPSGTDTAQGGQPSYAY
jgi:hypothetical protein